METAIIIIETLVIIAIIATGLVVNSNSILLKRTDYLELKNELDERDKRISRQNIQINFLQTAKDELWNKIHNKKKDAKGRFCKNNQEIANGTTV